MQHGTCPLHDVALGIHANDAARARPEPGEHGFGRLTEIQHRLQASLADLCCDVGDEFAGRRPRGNALAGRAAATTNRKHSLHSLPVACEHRVVGIELLEQQARQAPAVRVERHAVIDPVLLAEAFEQPAVVQQLQVPGDTRLALADNLGELGDRELATGQDREQAQARRLRDRPQTG